MAGGGGQVLPQGDMVNSGLAQIPEHGGYFRRGFSQAQHETGFGDDMSVVSFDPGQQV